MTSFVRAILEYIMLIFQRKQWKHAFSGDSEQEQTKINIQEAQRLASYLEQELVSESAGSLDSHTYIEKQLQSYQLMGWTYHCHFNLKFFINIEQIK